MFQLYILIEPFGIETIAVITGVGVMLILIEPFGIETTKSLLLVE